MDNANVMQEQQRILNSYGIKNVCVTLLNSSVLAAKMVAGYINPVNGVKTQIVYVVCQTEYLWTGGSVRNICFFSVFCVIFKRRGTFFSSFSRVDDRLLDENLRYNICVRPTRWSS